jgi:hypothetical protein
MRLSDEGGITRLQIMACEKQSLQQLGASIATNPFSDLFRLHENSSQAGDSSKPQLSQNSKADPQ